MGGLGKRVSLRGLHGESGSLSKIVNVLTW